MPLTPKNNGNANTNGTNSASSRATNMIPAILALPIDWNMVIPIKKNGKTI